MRMFWYLTIQCADDGINQTLRDFSLGISLVPLHLLFSVTGDEEGDFAERLYATIKNGTFLERTSEAFHPNNSWGPARIKEKTEWQIYCEEFDVNYWLPKCLRIDFLWTNNIIYILKFYMDFTPISSSKLASNHQSTYRSKWNWIVGGDYANSQERSRADHQQNMIGMIQYLAIVPPTANLRNKKQHYICDNEKAS